MPHVLLFQPFLRFYLSKRRDKLVGAVCVSTLLEILPEGKPFSMKRVLCGEVSTLLEILLPLPMKTVATPIRYGFNPS